MRDASNDTFNALDDTRLRRRYALVRTAVQQMDRHVSKPPASRGLRGSQQFVGSWQRWWKANFAFLAMRPGALSGKR